ncbi:MAG: phosphoenolpyruvate--protein phosphotransferase [Lachnospiraceae bacterium]|nr:phosphoenolpyruvate--protein phosphotransferase [Lachnospiraceae bacterium]
MRMIGKAVHYGIAVGPVVVIKPREAQVKRYKIYNTSSEMIRLEQSLYKVKNHLRRLYDKAVAEVGSEGAAIFNAHIMLLEDEGYLDSVHSIIQAEKVNAEYAVATTGTHFADMFAEMDDEYMQERSRDVLDVTGRVIRALQGQEELDFSEMEPSIILADDLTPGEVMQMDSKKMLALVTLRGSANSHTAILAAMMNIPAIVGVEFNLDGLPSGSIGIVDGYEGSLVIDATEEELAAAKEKIRVQEEEQMMLQRMKGKETVTKGGRVVKLLANIGGVQDISYALENDAEGIGLFRSEFLYLQKDCLPTEEEQLHVYKKVLQKMGDKLVTIRTLDIGADKQVEYLELGKEDNPALGFRAIRICLTRKDIFKTQLRALLRAGMYGNLAVLYPMITSVKEVTQIKEIVEEVRGELESEGVSYKLPIQGIMIETPAAVMISDQLAQLVDFFSIGTNDLTQYTLALDRQNERLDAFYDAHHPAVLKMIEMVVKSGHNAGIPVGICGELGSDMALTGRFIQMGVDELSVSPGNVLRLRAKIRDINEEEEG